MSSLETRFASRCDSALSEELIDCCDAEPDQAVTIVGARHIDLLVAFCRRRFKRAACQSAVGPHDPEGPADMIIIPDFSSETELQDALRNIAVTSSGEVVLRIARHILPSRFFHLYEVFARQGFVLTQHTKRLSDGSILHFAHKRDGVPHAHAA